MSEVNLKGLGVALITPFTRDGLVDFEALSQLVNFQIENGTSYIVALGTTAETPTLTDKEKVDVVDCIKKEVNNRVPVVIGIGGNSTAALVEEFKKTNFEGISAVLSVTPYYNKPTAEGLYQHYRAISEISPVPLILYNVPGRTGVKMKEDFNELFHLIFVEGNPAGVKSILHQKGMIENTLRLPLVPVSEKTDILIKEALKKVTSI